MKGNSFKCNCCGKKKEFITRKKEWKWKIKKGTSTYDFYCSYSCYNKKFKEEIGNGSHRFSYSSSNLGWSSVNNRGRRG